MLETWAKNEAMFNLYLAQQLAQVRIVSATAKPAADGAQEITVTVTNEGGIPTALEIAKRVKIVRPDTAVIQLAQGQTFVGGPAGGRAGGGGAGFGRGGGGRGGPGGPATAPTTGPRQSSELGWLKPGEQKTVSWTVRGAGNVTVGIESTRGGVDRRTVSLSSAARVVSRGGAVGRAKLSLLPSVLFQQLPQRLDRQRADGAAVAGHVASPSAASCRPPPPSRRARLRTDPTPRRSGGSFAAEGRWRR